MVACFIQASEPLSIILKYSISYSSFVDGVKYPNVDCFEALNAFRDTNMQNESSKSKACGILGLNILHPTNYRPTLLSPLSPSIFSGIPRVFSRYLGIKQFGVIRIPPPLIDWEERRQFSMLMLSPRECLSFCTWWEENSLFICQVHIQAINSVTFFLKLKFSKLPVRFVRGNIPHGSILHDFIMWI